MFGFLNSSTSRRIKGVTKSLKNVQQEPRGFSRDARKPTDHSKEADSIFEPSVHVIYPPVVSEDDLEHVDEEQSNSLVLNRVPDDYLREDAKVALAASAQYQASLLSDALIDRRDPFAVQLADGFVMITIDGNITRVSTNGEKVWSVSTGGPMMTSNQVFCPSIIAQRSRYV